MSDATRPANPGETRSFPTVGADRVADTLVAVARLSADEQARIAAAARGTAAICFTPDPAGAPGDAAIAELLAPASSTPRVDDYPGLRRGGR